MSDDPEAKADRKDQAPRRLRPTIIEPPARRAEGPQDAPSRPGAPRAPTPIVRAPTAIPGAQRSRVPVNTADMARLSPNATPRTAARAVRLVETFVVEGADDLHVDQWGLAVQQRCAALTLDEQALLRPELVDQARDYVGRIAERLAAIDIEAICKAGPSPLFGLLEPASERVDTPRKLAAVRTRLSEFMGLTQAALDPLLKLQTSLDDHARHIDESSLEIESAALAALFLSEHLATAWPELSRRFLQREMSLTETAVELRSAQFARTRQVEEPRALIAAIRDVVLTTLPEWLASIAPLTSAARRDLNPVEVNELQHRLRAILRNLQA